MVGEIKRRRKEKKQYMLKICLWIVSVIFILSVICDDASKSEVCISGFEYTKTDNNKVYIMDNEDGSLVECVE